MEKVDFYILDRADTQARSAFVCRLVDKILSRSNTVEILVADQPSAMELDALLWQIPPESFSPHALVDGDANPDEPVLISARDRISDIERVCINLRPQAPQNHADARRLVEIVCQEPTVLASTRAKYKFYRELSYPLQSHPIHDGAY